MKTFIFSKTSDEVITVTPQVETVIKDLVEIELISVEPETDNMLGVQYAYEGGLNIKCQGGLANTTYCLTFNLKGIEETATIRVIIVVSDSAFDPITCNAPDSFMDLVGSIQAGESVVSTCVFSVPTTQENVNDGYVTWELLDSDSNVLSSGNAFSYDATTNGLDWSITAQSVIVCPSDTEPTNVGRRYQIRYTLTLENKSYYQFEAVTVGSNVTVPIGASDMVELAGRKANVSLVLPKLYEVVTVAIYKDNSQIVEDVEMGEPQRVASGWLYTKCLNTGAFTVTLDSYDVVFTWYNTSVCCDKDSTSCKLWIINPSIKSAADDMLAKIWKARTTLYGAPDLIYPMPTVLTWLRRGKDLFNSWQGLFTSFTMTNAKGVIREYWLQCSELGALEAQYLAEGEKAFDFSGSAISLNVDRTGFLETMASNIRSNLDNNLKPIKTVMIEKGYTSGDGSGTDGEGGIATNIRALGAVGISITPASAWGRYSSAWLLGRAWI